MFSLRISKSAWKTQYPLNTPLTVAALALTASSSTTLSLNLLLLSLKVCHSSRYGFHLAAFTLEMCCIDVWPTCLLQKKLTDYDITTTIRSLDSSLWIEYAASRGKEIGPDLGTILNLPYSREKEIELTECHQLRFFQQGIRQLKEELKCILT